MSTDNGDDDILDRLNDDPVPTIPIRPAQPPVAPAPGSSPPGPASSRGYSRHHVIVALVGGFLSAVAVIAGLILLSAWLERAPSPRVDGVALGRAFRAPLAASLADGFDAYAEAMEHGKTAGDADEALKKTFHDSRTKAFAEKASAPFASLVPAGAEPKDDEAKRQFIQLHRDFAKGLRSR